MPDGYDPNKLIDMSSTMNSTGTGAVDRKEKIELQVAAIIVDQLPNGNFIIAGRQEVRVNYELRELLVQGIIRPEGASARPTPSTTSRSPRPASPMAAAARSPTSSSRATASRSWTWSCRSNGPTRAGP
jgi:hypothetical protein